MEEKLYVTVFDNEYLNRSHKVKLIAIDNSTNTIYWRSGEYLYVNTKIQYIGYREVVKESEICYYKAESNISLPLAKYRPYTNKGFYKPRLGDRILYTKYSPRLWSYFAYSHNPLSLLCIFNYLRKYTPRTIGLYILEYVYC